MAGEPPPGPLVEFGLVGELLFLGCSPGRHRQVPQLFGQQGREQLPIDQQRLSGERLHPTLVGDGQEGLMDARLRQSVMHHPWLAERIPGIPNDVLDGAALSNRL